jgi:hypothetical protein
MENFHTLVWIILSHLPIIFWDEDSLKYIGDKLGHYIDQVEPKGNIYSYARICVKIDFEKGLLKEIQLNLEGWSHFQALDYYEKSLSSVTFSMSMVILLKVIQELKKFNLL